jgi:hypothetical protein
MNLIPVRVGRRFPSAVGAFPVMALLSLSPVVQDRMRFAGRVAAVAKATLSVALSKEIN